MTLMERYENSTPRQMMEYCATLPDTVGLVILNFFIQRAILYDDIQVGIELAQLAHELEHRINEVPPQRSDSLTPTKAAQAIEALLKQNYDHTELKRFGKLPETQFDCIRLVTQALKLQPDYHDGLRRAAVACDVYIADCAQCMETDTSREAEAARIIRERIMTIYESV